MPYKEDVTWYLNEGHTLEDLLNLIRNTVYGVENIKGENFSLLNYHFSDVGNAERIIALYGSDIRYNFPLNRFFIWNGRYWSMDNTGIIYKMAKSMLRRLLAEGEALEESEEEPNNDTKKKVISFAIKSESDSRIKAMVNQIKSQPEITLADCDTDPFLLNLSNGTLNLKTRMLREHSKGDYITRMIDIEYDKNAGCPQWMNFLHKVFLEDDQTLDFVQKSVGYSLTGSQEEQCFYMLSGTGANGKTTFLNTIKMIMGDYADVLKASSLMARQYDDGARGDIAKLKNKRFVVSSELNEGQYFDESLIKCVTGGETVPVRFLYGEEFNLKPEFKIWMGTNEKPRIRGTDHSTWRRFWR